MNRPPFRALALMAGLVVVHPTRASAQPWERQGPLPEGHRPAPGECRFVVPDLPPGHQPAPVPCDLVYGLGRAPGAEVGVAFDGRVPGSRFEVSIQGRWYPAGAVGTRDGRRGGGYRGYAAAPDADRETWRRYEEAVREARKRQDESDREAWKHYEETVREARKRQAEADREAWKRHEERLREARKRDRERARDRRGGGGR